MDDVLKAAEAEERKLIALLESSPTFKRLRAIQNLIQVYKSNSPQDHAAPKERSGHGTQVPDGKRKINPSSKSKTAQIEQLVKSYLRENNRRATSGELLRVAQKAGIQIGGKKPISTMSSFLSNISGLNNVLGKGYGLTEWPTESDKSQQREEQNEFSLGETSS